MKKTYDSADKENSEEKLLARKIAYTKLSAYKEEKLSERKKSVKYIKKESRKNCALISTIA